MEQLLSSPFLLFFFLNIINSITEELELETLLISTFLLKAKILNYS